MNKIQSNILEQYRYIVDETNIVSKSDLLGTITYANSKFLEASGYSLIELLGRAVPCGPVERRVSSL